MRGFATAAIGVTTAALVSAGVLIGAAPAASANASGCDSGWPPSDVYQVVRGGSSFSYAGRDVRLMNGSWRNYSYGEITIGTYHRGDRIWVDRSRKKMPKTPAHPANSLVQKPPKDGDLGGDGWKQCGPFSRSNSKSVLNWNTTSKSHYAARVCIDPAGATPYRCGTWYTDAS